MIAVRRMCFARWVRIAVVSLMGMEESQRGRGIEVHMYRPLFFCSSG